MFSNLSKGSVLYGLDRKNGNKLFTATVESVSLPRPRFNQNTFGQIPEYIVDIVANINGERREFQQVPNSNVVADFGADSLVISDSKDSLANHIKSLRQESKNVIDSAPMHQERIPQYDAALNELDPATANDNVVKELRGQVEGMQSQMAEILSLLNQKTPNAV
jgi:malonyl CoA-acyl carrier protein transacylase